MFYGSVMPNYEHMPDTIIRLNISPYLYLHFYLKEYKFIL